MRRISALGQLFISMAEKGFFNIIFGIIVATAALWFLFVVVPVLTPLNSSSLLAKFPKGAFSSPGTLRGKIEFSQGRQLLLFDDDKLTLLHSLQLNGSEYALTVPPGAYWVSLNPLPGIPNGKLPGFVVVNPGKVAVLDL